MDERDAGPDAAMAAASWGEPAYPRAVEGGADTSAQDDGGDTALHEAARADEVESLMMPSSRRGEGPQNKLGATPAFSAARETTRRRRL